MEHDSRTGKQERRIAVADMVLKLDPKNVTAILHKASACSRLVKERYIAKYSSPGQIPESERMEFEALSRCNIDGFAKAEALGWEEETQGEKNSYRRSIEQVKARQGGNR
jgi:hypothetical protein